MRTSHQWISHFRKNATQQRIDWSLAPTVTEQELSPILRSFQSWQLGETPDGGPLLKATRKYARKMNDPSYLEAIGLFINEEQKHSDNLGAYLDRIGKPRLKADICDTLFRKVRYFNTSMEIWTLTVLVVESIAQLFYQSLKDATHCALLKQISTDILIDEAHHVAFQRERLSIFFQNRSRTTRFICLHLYKVFFAGTVLIAWTAYKNVFIAGGHTFSSYLQKMKYKYYRSIHNTISHKKIYYLNGITA
ncbi:ferritin-like domain-containing protein [Chitinophaga pinensis]|uniref:Ferritin-like domain-containing protein n=1 Tax=Chitinophaga pinensis TaxID=79329 RepID=A0A5C6LQU2_9BACT|nr:ferritin-like domain-containing protein [Chitinophaga pinensis]TWV98936.1 ferritin-like domain-containing protein [Chitinophaga pinensis]